MSIDRTIFKTNPPLYYVAVQFKNVKGTGLG